MPFLAGVGGLATTPQAGQPNPGYGRQPRHRAAPSALHAGDLMRRNVILLIAGVCLLGDTASARAQDEWTGQVNRLLNQAASTAMSNGMRRTHEPYIGSLRVGATTSHAL